MFFQISDWIITYVECVVALAAVLEICKPKFSGKKHRILLLCFAGLNMCGTAVLNHISAFSFATPIFSVLFLFLVAGFLSHGALWLRAAASIMVPFVILSIGYALMIIACLIYGGDFIQTFSIFMTPGWRRLLLVGTDKIADIIVLCVCRKYLGMIFELSKRWILVLFSFSCIFYGLTQHLFSAILSGDYSRLQRASILSFLVLILFFIAVSMLLLSVSARERQSLQQRLLEKTNLMMEQNYKLMHEDILENAKRLHDFHHHLRVISTLAEQTASDAVVQYVESLLEVSYRESAMCHSKNDIIDAVINCSIVEAQKCKIQFDYELFLSSKISLAPMDLCAVLGNQIENAIEACQQIPEEHSRYVRVTLSQRGGFFVSRVVNSAAEDPFSAEGKLVTRKKDTTLHGLGIKSIQSTAEKYNGYVKNSYANHVFTSEALMCIEQFSTQNHTI